VKIPPRSSRSTFEATETNYQICPDFIMKVITYRAYYVGQCL